MSRKHTADSSLELLLDTMCNTFGGVMFIAILLAVMITIRGHETRSLPTDQSEKIAECKQQITRLQNELADITRKTEEQAKLLETMNSDPRLQLIREIAIVERMHKEKLLVQKMMIQKVNLSRSTLKNLEIQTLKTDEELKKTEQKVKEQLAQMKKHEEKLEVLQKKIGSLDLKKMFFMTMVKTEKIPYFILVNNGRIWPVGPEISGDSYTPNPAVTHQIKSDRFFCYPVPEKGISIFSGSALAPGFQQFLGNLPADRVPEFVISRSDAPDFYRLREILKQQKIFHGFRLQPSDLDFFDYQFVNRDKGDYEY